MSARFVMGKTFAGVVVLALASCAPESAGSTKAEIDLAAKACESVTDFAQWQLCKFNFNQNIEATARKFRAQSAGGQPVRTPTPDTLSPPQWAVERETGWDAAASVLLLGTAFLNGYNRGRPVTTTCFTTGIMTQCTSP